jgi:hypothetical protein
MNELDMKRVIDRLAIRRPIFHSEADFQHALAWELQREHPDADVRLELPLSGLKGRGALDIVIRAKSFTASIEVKYVKANLAIDVGGESFSLPPTVARDIFRHDVCKDVTRVEHAIGSNQATLGFVIVLGNDRAIWQDTGFAGIDSDFKIHHDRELTGCLKWGEKAGLGTRKNRDVPLDLRGTYKLNWHTYSDLKVTNGQFKILVIPVNT